jgi:hypothetical protein
MAFQGLRTEQAEVELGFPSRTGKDPLEQLSVFPRSVVRLTANVHLHRSLPALESLRAVVLQVYGLDVPDMDRLALALVARTRTRTPELEVEIEVQYFSCDVGQSKIDKALRRSKLLSSHGHLVRKLLVDGAKCAVSLSQLPRLQEVSLRGYGPHPFPPCTAQRLTLDSCEPTSLPQSVEYLALTFCAKLDLDLVGEAVRELSIRFGQRDKRHEIARLITRLPALTSLKLISTALRCQDDYIVEALPLVMPRLESLELELLDLPRGVACPLLKRLICNARALWDASQLPVAPRLETVRLACNPCFDFDELRNFLRPAKDISLRVVGAFDVSVLPDGLEHLVLDTDASDLAAHAHAYAHKARFGRLQTLGLTDNADLTALRRAFPNTLVTRTTWWSER